MTTTAVAIDTIADLPEPIRQKMAECFSALRSKGQASRAGGAKFRTAVAVLQIRKNELEELCKEHGVLYTSLRIP